MASAFFHQAFPGTKARWDNALTSAQEHALWKQAQPLLTQGGLTVYSEWFYGGDAVPKWAGFTIWLSHRGELHPTPSRNERRIARRHTGCDDPRR